MKPGLNSKSEIPILKKGNTRKFNITCMANNCIKSNRI